MRFSMHGGRASRALRASLGVPCHLMKHSHVGRDVFCYFLFFVPPPPNTWALLRDYTRQVVALHEACGWHDMGLVADITLVMSWLFVHVDRTYRCWHVFGDCRCLSCIKLMEVRRYTWERGSGPNGRKRRKKRAERKEGSATINGRVKKHVIIRMTTKVGCAHGGCMMVLTQLCGVHYNAHVVTTQCM